MTNVTGTKFRDIITIASGAQTMAAGDGNDHIIAYSDGGEPVPAQTGSPEDLVHGTVPAGTADDILTGGKGRDTFEFRLLIDAKESVIAAHTNLAGATNWAAVAGENDNVHDHWVEKIGNDIITDFNKAEGDKIKIKGHTVQVKSIEFDSDDVGTFSLITLYSQQGDGGAGGANTETGAHDEDVLGTIKVYGDEVVVEDVTVENSNEGLDRLLHADATNANKATGLGYLTTDGTSYFGELFKITDKVHLGLGSQYVDTGGDNDTIYSYSDAGEPDPAQTDGAVGRVTDDVPADLSVDYLKGGQGRDMFAFRLLLDAKQEIIDEHTRGDGTINWRRVAGENGDVHDHWVAGIGTDVILDFSKQDGDKIDIRGHTVEIASLTHVEGTGPQDDYSIITLRSQQGEGGGAHDEDMLGEIWVYGDKVTEDDISIKSNVFYGIDQLDDIGSAETVSVLQPGISQIQYGDNDPDSINLRFEGSRVGDTLHLGSGVQFASGQGGNDHLISYADAGEPDPAQTDDGLGRVNSKISPESAMDVLEGGAGADRFEFHVLLNARREIIEQHTGSNGQVNWRSVAGENDNIHDHWVRSIGLDTILDYSKSEGDRIIVRGHTAEIAGVSYHADDAGDYSLIELRSQQGDGGAGGANTETGAHDEDSLGKIKVYGEKVLIDDIVVQAVGVFDGADKLTGVDALADYNGGVQQLFSNTTYETVTSGPNWLDTVDHIVVGGGAQQVNSGVGRDFITSYSDAGEPDPAQTEGSNGRQTDALDPNAVNDTISGGQDSDVFTFNFLLNATDEVRAEHTRADGSINWRGVAGENDDTHLHWVEGIGQDVILDYSNQDGDKIHLRGHTVEIASIQHLDNGGPESDYTLISVRSQQGDGGGAHDEDLLGTIKVFGDLVEIDDIKVSSKVFDGIDEYEDGVAEVAQSLIYGDAEDNNISGTDARDVIHAEGGQDFVSAADGDDFVFGGGGDDLLLGGAKSDYLDGEGGNDQLFGESGDDILYAASGRDVLVGGAGDDVFMFGNGLRKAEVLDWTKGDDLIDFSRIDTVQSLNDLEIESLAPTFSKIEYEDEGGRSVNVTIVGSTAFEFDGADFVF